jgi:hypothetical protein
MSIRVYTAKPGSPSGGCDYTAATSARSIRVEIIRRDAATGMLLTDSDPRDGWALTW